MLDAHDELIDRAAAALRRRNGANPRLVARVLDAVEGRPRRWWRAVTWPSTPFSLTATATLAAAGLLLGFLSNEATSGNDRSAVAVTPGAQVLPVVPTARDANEALPIPVQFTLRDVRASQVALVGDFNGWSPTTTLLEPGREPGTWSVTVPLSVGRHVYAFVVDGRTWMTDPRAQRAQDLDFGRENSVLIVQAP
ncbi:MAG: isoamylase early set domain-containing protein [Gemmatimonadaceae bacterium]|nr:isoamylase early set domain-containing protein [Gemmatimonadaceae bacterium]